MLKVGIAGMGGMGWFHASRYLQLENAALVAIADVIPQRLEAQEAIQINLADKAREFDFAQVARYPDARTLIAEADVDVVDLCLPTDLHAPYAIEALRAGRHVLSEKPMALTVADADAMIAAAEEAGRKLMIAQCIRFWPEYRYLRRAIEEQIYGRLLSLNMLRIGGRPGWSEDNWFLDPARSGGPILDLHIHDVDFVNAVLGAPQRLYAVGRGAADSRAIEVIHACFDYDDGPQVHIHGGWAPVQIPFQHGFEAWFDRGFLRYDGQDLVAFEGSARVDPQPVTAVQPGDAYLNEIAYFLNCIERDLPLTECPPESARDSVALVHREIAAIETHAPYETAY